MSVIYDYSFNNPEVNNPYSQLDYGSISSAVTETEDVGLVADSSPTFDFFENFYGFITVSESLSPFGNINISTSTTSDVTITVSEIGFGSIPTVGVLDENVIFTWVGTGTVFEIANGLERTVNPYVASGTLRIDQTVAETALESFTYDYNESSVSSQNVQDYSSISSPPSGLLEDYGLINEPLDTQSEDYAFVYGEVIDVVYPFGEISLSGSALTQPNYRLYLDGNAIIKVVYSESPVGLLTFSGGYDNLQFISQTPENTQLFNVSGTVLESFSAQTPENTQLFNVSGTVLESLSAQTPENTQLFNVSGTLVEKNVESYVGIETLTLSGTVLESFSTQTPENTQLFNVSGTVLESFSAQTPENTQLFNVSGELNHPNIDYTPHYGIEKNIGIGTTGIQLSGSVILVDVNSYVGAGTLFGFGEKLESRTYVYDEFDFIEFVTFDYGFISSSPTQSSEDYGDLSYTPSADDYGFLYDLTGQLISSTQFPFGSIFVLNGFSPQESYPWLPEPGVGRSWSFTRKTYIASGVTTISGISSNREIQIYGQDYVTSGTLTLSGSLVEKDIDSYVGVGTLTLSGTAIESLSAQTPENTQLFSISGTLVESFSANTPEDTQLFSISGTLVEKNAESYVGIETLTLSGTVLESFSAQTPEDTPLFVFTSEPSYNLNREYKSTETPPPITLSGELNHPNIDYTPHYGIEKNIGIGTTGIKFLRGVGFTPDSEGNPRDARTYSNRYPINDKVPGAGIGTILFDQTNNLAKYSPLTPYTGTGLFNIITGFSPQESYPWLPGPGVGRSWSFTRTTYISSGTLFVFGIASTREIAVYGYYGDDRDPGTSGSITISQQTSPIIIKETDSYVGVGTYILSGTANFVESRSYNGSGILTISETALEVYSAQTPEDIQLFSISGTALEVYSAQTPEIEVLYIISGNLSERKTNYYVGDGTLTLNGTATTIEVPNYPSTGLIRFISRTVDHNYDTCDSEEFTCDNQDSANVRFVANPVETTILFEISGIASTREIATYEYIGISTYILSGFIENIKLTYSEVASGNLFTISFGIESESEVYVGSGNLFTLSGSSQSYSTQIPESTVLINIFGSAVTSIESEYSNVGIGLFNFYGFADTRRILVYSQVASGIITLSGELIYPDIIFIPAPSGLGTINILGSSDDFLTKTYIDIGGTLFAFSSGPESFTRDTYIGIGTIYIQEVSSTTINNPFQIPRTYVVII